jgi:chromate transporter
MKSTVTTKNYTATLLQLFTTFLKIGAFTFGGGFAMLPVIEREVVTRRQWLTAADMMEMVIISESTPGVIAVNSATSVGYRTRGVLGGIVATLGVILPSFLIILALSFAVTALQGNAIYTRAFLGIQTCVCVLIFNAFISLFRNVARDIFCYILLVASFTVALFTNFNVILLIIIGGAVGVVYTLLRRGKNLLPIQPAEADEEE